MKISLGLCAALTLVWGCGSNSASQPNKYGSVSLYSVSEGVTSDDPNQFFPKAFFYKYTSSGTGVCDTYVDDGTCRVWQCNDDAYTTLPGISVLDAGTLSVSGAQRELAFARGDDGGYGIGDFDGSPLWSGGETLTASIGGSTDVPAAMLSIQAPPALSVTAPASSEPLSIDVSKDVAISWK